MKENNYIIHIDTSTDICSVALSDGNIFINEVIDESGERRHAAMLPLMVDQLLNEYGVTKQKIKAIAYSKGPGSYTGLRVGISTAKAICYALQIPLIGVSTLHSIAYSAENLHPSDLIVAMIDAGRNEVYYNIYSSAYKELQSAQANDISESLFYDFLSMAGNIILVGDAVPKAKTILPVNDKIVYSSEKVLARNLINPAYEKYSVQDFENLAYASPDYLKAPQYKKKVINI